MTSTTRCVLRNWQYAQEVVSAISIMDDCLSYMVAAFLPPLAAGRLATCSKSWRGRVHQHSPTFSQLRFSGSLLEGPPASLTSQYDTICATKIQITTPALEVDAILQTIRNQAHSGSLHILEIVHDNVAYASGIPRRHFTIEEVIEILATVGRSLKAFRFCLFTSVAKFSDAFLSAIWSNCPKLERLHLFSSLTEPISRKNMQLMVSSLPLLQDLTIPAAEADFSSLWRLKHLSHLAVASNELHNQMSPYSGKHPSKLRQQLLDFMNNTQLHPPSSSPIHPGAIAVAGGAYGRLSYVPFGSVVLQGGREFTDFSAVIDPGKSPATLSRHMPWESVITIAIENKQVNFLRAVAQLPDGLDFLRTAPVSSVPRFYHAMNCIEHSLMCADDLDEAEDVKFLLTLVELAPDDASARHHILSFCSSLDIMKLVVSEHAHPFLKGAQEAGTAPVQQLVEMRGPNNMTVLHESARLPQHNSQNISYLLSIGADASALDGFGRLPLTLSLPLEDTHTSPWEQVAYFTESYCDSSCIDEELSRKFDALLPATPDSAFEVLEPEHISTMLVGATKLGQSATNALLSRFCHCCNGPTAIAVRVIELATLRGPLFPQFFELGAFGRVSTTLAAAPFIFQTVPLKFIFEEHLKPHASAIPHARLFEFATCTLEGLHLVLWINLQQNIYGALQGSHSEWTEKGEGWAQQFEYAIEVFSYAASGSDFLQRLMMCPIRKPVLPKNRVGVLIESTQTAGAAFIELFLRWINRSYLLAPEAAVLFCNFIKHLRMSPEFIRSIFSADDRKSLSVLLASAQSRGNEDISEILKAFAQAL